MKRLLASAALAATTLAAGMAAAQDGTDLVTIITSPEPQTQLMALVLTFQAAQQGATRISCSAVRPVTSP
jgi:ABC-type glycerol-3-phosphate transport system substrate-binding protein